MHTLYSASYEPTPTATIPYEEQKELVITSISDLTPSGKLFKLSDMLQKCKSTKTANYTHFLDNLQLTTICKELLKELSNDPHLQSKP